MSQRDEVSGKLPLDCASCEFDDVTKRSMHCGWMDESTWIGEHGEYPPIAGYDGACCPGRLMCLPMIREAEIGVSAFRNGSLGLYYPESEASVLAAVMELDAAFNRFEAEQIKPKNV